MFEPESPPENGTPQEIIEWAHRQFQSISESQRAPKPMEWLGVLNVAPIRPRDGMIAYADGTNWNPGAGGEGVYAYYNSTWNRLG